MFLIGCMIYPIPFPDVVWICSIPFPDMVLDSSSGAMSLFCCAVGMRYVSSPLLQNQFPSQFRVEQIWSPGCGSARIDLGKWNKSASEGASMD